MRDYLARPTSIHDDPNPEEVIKWDEFGRPSVFRGKVAELRDDDEWCRALWKECCRQEKYVRSDAA
jgi:hypothetical protein